MARAKQLSFGSEFLKPRTEFGGDLLKNSNAKRSRPLDSKLPVHLVLKSNKSVLRTHKNFGFVQSTIEFVFKRHGVKLYSMANVGNHLHFVIRIHSRRSWGAMIRELTGRLAYRLGTPGERFWYKLPFTRVVGGWHKAFKSIKNYVLLNQWEAEGFIDRREIRRFADLKKIWGETG